VRQQKIKKITSLFPNLRDSFDLENKLAKPQKKWQAAKSSKSASGDKFIYLSVISVLCFSFNFIRRVLLEFCVNS